MSIIQPVSTLEHFTHLRVQRQTAVNCLSHACFAAASHNAQDAQLLIQSPSPAAFVISDIASAFADLNDEGDRRAALTGTGVGFRLEDLQNFLNDAGMIIRPIIFISSLTAFEKLKIAVSIAWVVSIDD